MQRVITAGGTIAHNGEILLIRHKGGGLAFAKGHLDEAETPEMAAIREMKEETGYDTAIIKRLGELERVTTEITGERVNKIIVLYLMRATKQAGIAVDELPVWIAPNKALGDMQFPEEAAFLRDHLNDLRS